MIFGRLLDGLLILPAFLFAMVIIGASLTFVALFGMAFYNLCTSLV